MNGATESFEMELEQAQVMVTQTPFFSQRLNTAIIDGPLRIYFADHHENHALEIYFGVQEGLLKHKTKLEKLPRGSSHVFLMMYPDSTELAPSQILGADSWSQNSFGEHKILGLPVNVMDNGPQIKGQIIGEIVQSLRDLAG